MPRLSCGTCSSSTAGTEVLTSTLFPFIFSGEQVLKQVSQELQGTCCQVSWETRQDLGLLTVFERIAGAMKQLQEIKIILQMHQWGYIFCAKLGVTPIYDVLQIVRGNLTSRDVQTQDLESKLLIRKILPTLL